MVSWIASAELQGDGQASLLSLMDLKCSLGEVLTADSPVSAAAEDAGDIHLTLLPCVLSRASANFGAVGNL